MTTAKDIMHSGARWMPSTETLDRVAQVMREDGVGALPVSNTEERLCGIVTDRDIVIKCVAGGHDPATATAGDLTQGTPRWIAADASVEEALEEMRQHRIRRLPVIENKQLVGMISEADVARHLSDGQVAATAKKLYESD